MTNILLVSGVEHNICIIVGLMINGTLLCFQKCPNLGKLYIIQFKPTLSATDVRKLLSYYLKMFLDPKVFLVVQWLKIHLQGTRV